MRTRRKAVAGRSTLLTVAGLALLATAACSSTDTGTEGEAATTTQALTTEVECSLGSGVEHHALRASWPALAGASTASVGSQGIELVLSNEAGEPLYAETSAALLADGREVEHIVSRNVLVRAGATGSVWIHPASLGLSLSNLRFSGRLRVRTVFRDAAGAVRGSAQPNVLSFHPTSTGGLLVYGDEARRTQFRGGDYASRVPGLGPNVGSVLVANATEPVDTQTPDVIKAPPPVTGHRICFKFDVAFSDSDVGEDFFKQNGPMIAHAVEYEVLHGGKSLTSGTANLDDGCTPDLNLTQTTGLTVRMRAVANLGHSEPDDRIDDHFKVIGIDGDGDEPFVWSFEGVDLGPAPSVVGLKTDPGPMANLVGAAVHTAWRIDKLTFPTGLVNPPNQVVHLHQHPGKLCEEGCMADGELWLANEAIVAEKFGVSHEVGHWLHKSWMFGTTGSMTGQYDEPFNAPETDKMCTFPESHGPGGHAMRSLEPGSAAFTEGVAHFLAAVAWNDNQQEDGRFKYYKESIIDSSGQSMDDDAWIVDLEADGPNALGGDARWRKTRCRTKDAQMPGNAPKYYSTEMDWLRFWWDLSTDAPSKHGGSARPTMRQYFRFLQHLWSQHKWFDMWSVWPKIQAASTTAEGAGVVPSGFLQRFQETAVQNGIDQP